MNIDQSRQCLHAALQHKDPLIAATSARLIGDIQDQASASALVNYCLQSRAYSKTVAMDSLMRLRAESAIDMFQSLLIDPLVPDDHYWTGYKSVRVSAAVHLLMWGRDDGHTLLQEFIANNDNVVKRFYLPSILRIEHAVAKPIQEQLQFDAVFNTAAQRALLDTGYSDATQVAYLCEALGLLSDERADQELQSYLHFHSRFVRVAAARSLILRQGDAVLPILRIALQQPGSDFERIYLASLVHDTDVLLHYARQAALPFDRICAVGYLQDCDVATNDVQALLEQSEMAVQSAVLELLLHAPQYRDALAAFSTDDQVDAIAIRLAALQIQACLQEVV